MLTELLARIEDVTRVREHLIAEARRAVWKERDRATAARGVNLCRMLLSTDDDVDGTSYNPEFQTLTVLTTSAAWTGAVDVERFLSKWFTAHLVNTDMFDHTYALEPTSA